MIEHTQEYDDLASAKQAYDAITTQWGQVERISFADGAIEACDCSAILDCVETADVSYSKDGHIGYFSAVLLVCSGCGTQVMVETYERTNPTTTN